MADIHPFRALRYDLQKVSASQVVTQPYDKISPAMQDRYYAASPYNLVRIILGRHEPLTRSGKNGIYPRRRLFPRLARPGHSAQDSLPPDLCPIPSLHRPGESGTSFERRGFIALGRVEDYSAKVVFRHEQTLAKPKADRLDLLRATRAHFEQTLHALRRFRRDRCPLARRGRPGDRRHGRIPGSQPRLAGFRSHGDRPVQDKCRTKS
jgi:hypothetical protein